MTDEEPCRGSHVVVYAWIVLLFGLFLLLAELWIDPARPQRPGRPPIMPWQRRVIGVLCVAFGWRMWALGRQIVRQERSRDDDAA